jgi:hypothetical protein
LSTTDENTLADFERKGLRSIYGLIKDNNERRIRYNYALRSLHEHTAIITSITVGRLKRAGHVVRVDQQRPAKGALNAKPEGGRERRRLKLR